MSETKMPVMGQKVGEMSPEELKAEQQRTVEEKKKIINDLNKIKYPLSVTVFSHHGTWTIRNKEFWKAMQKRDDQIVDFMEKYLTERK